MKLSPVIATLRARCGLFEGRVGGAGQFKNLPQIGKLPLPAAYVLPANDEAGEQKSQTDYWQDLREGFSVVVVLDNTRDERGQAATFDAVHDVRAELWRALLGWSPEQNSGPITYLGGELLELDRGRIYYQYDFEVVTEIDINDTRQQEDLDALPEFETLAIDVDFIDPGNGPDKKIEAHTRIDLTQE